MRFKKIFDASKAPQPEAKESGKSSDGRKKRNDRNDRRGKDGQGRKDAETAGTTMKAGTIIPRAAAPAHPHRKWQR